MEHRRGPPARRTWHLERVKCSVCGRGGKLLYLGLEDERDKPFLPAQTEACGDCGHYLKLVPREFNARAEPLADDLASLALDVALAEQGNYQRSGYNPLLIAGE
ncbi:formate dehydrogenase accessory protein FdhE [Azotobacter sp. CWF10]|uniref:formate dehydrogenase accessory protein FdhE domain-containing protein n=1 Tax=Azotobacter salinestris TaxID=69964 RepID=UPI0035EE882E